MVEVTLEERALRRDYKLPCECGCYICFNNEDPMWNFVTIHVHEGIHQVCTKNHWTEINRKCSRCGTILPLFTDICHPCEIRINDIIMNEKLIEEENEQIEEFKRKARKKQITDLSAETCIILCNDRIKEYQSNLKELGVVNPAK